MRSHPAPRHRGARLRWLWLLVGVAWMLAVVSSLTGKRTFIDHHFLLEESGLPWPLAVTVFLVGWQIMIVAMMVPSSIVDLTASSPSRRGVPSIQALAGMYFGYAGVWTLFGLIAFSADTLIHRLVDVWPWLAAHSFVIGAATFAMAGLFQFTWWKSACLARCHALHHLAASTDTVRSAWRLGIRHGAASVGCSWALMLVMFGIGAGALGWMVTVTAIMLGEAIMSGEALSRRACHVVGTALFLLAGLWLAHPLWLVPAIAS